MKECYSKLCFDFVGKHSMYLFHVYRLWYTENRFGVMDVAMGRSIFAIKQFWIWRLLKKHIWSKV